MLAFFTLLAFVAFMVGTPGPANLIVMLAGVRQGLRQCIGFILGLIVGKIGLNLVIGFGFGIVLAEAPVWQMLLSYCQRWLYDLACVEIMASKRCRHRQRRASQGSFPLS